FETATPAVRSQAVPYKGSKRVEADTVTELFLIQAKKKPRLDIQDQIERASVLATQLRDSVKDDAEITTSATKQSATEELVQIFESMQEKTVSASKSLDDLITTQINLEVKLKMKALLDITNAVSFGPSKPKPLRTEIQEYLAPHDPRSEERIVRLAHEKMAGVTSGDYTAKITEAVMSAIVEEFQKGIEKQLRSLLE
ncbi:unnamed protein product, partial [Aureobasidium uvarum]